MKRLPPSRRGAALLLVLGILVLICALVLSFFSSVNTELSASQSYANGATVKQLSDSAVQVAISQVVAGTQGTANGAALAWASQPGMIRTYDTSGNAGKFYKLYSAPKMVVDGAGFSPSGEAPPADWDSAANNGLFTDLNGPVTRNGTVYFPILDPRALSATASQSVEGFSYQAGTDGVVIPGGAADSQRLPMPVRWLYVLQNGKLAVPSTASGGKVSFDATDPTAAPTAANPIVGRIAFWTDDETCKININTASEGTFWDRPWMNTATEQKFSTAIPVQNEFQRYPGHPATTCLSPVLGPLLPSSVLLKTQLPAQLKAYYDLVPRIADGGTLGGTVDDSAASAITPDGDRLYASPDELLYAPGRTANPTLTNTFLEKAKFFLTAHSRAPETNLYGLPRIALWPLMANASLRNAKDKLIAFCSTIGGNAYYFQRQTPYGGPASVGSSQSATLDWTGVKRNQDLYSYLDGLTSKAIPGFGGDFAAKYPSTRKQILTEMLDMIRGGVNTYSTALTPAYNYAPQLGDTGEGQVIPLHPGNGTQGFGRYATVTSAALVFFRSNAAPYTIAGTPPVVTITTAAQIRCALILNPFTPSPGLPTWSPNLQYVVGGLDKFAITTAGGGTVSLGFPIQVNNTTTARIGFSGGGNAMPFFGVQAQFRYANDSGLGLAGKDGTKTTGTDPKLNYPLVSPASAATGLSDTTFDFTGNTITVTIYAGADTALATPLQTISLPFDGIKGLPIPTTNPTSATYNPSGTDYTYFSRFAESAANTISKPYRTRLFESGTAALPLPGPPATTVSYAYQDVVRGVEPDPTGPAKGDLRVYAALATVPANYFRHSPGYDQLVGAVQQYHFTQSLRDEGFLTGGPQFGYDDKAGGVDPHWDFTPDTSDNRVNNLTFIQTNSGFLVDKQYLASYGGNPAYGTVGQPQYRGAASPAVPRGLTAALDASGNPGDWDNMTGITEDGPYINKPDEGNGATSSALKNVSYMSFTLSGGYFSYGLDLQNLGGDYRADNGQTFSPNRQVASAVMFGSLPTGIDPGNAASVQPWRTLLFCANPAAGTAHFGFGTGQGGAGPAALPPFTTPPDWLLLDLFTMPVVEPYAISEPLSTAGKVNMNYQIVPFSYIARDTAVRGVLKAARLLAIPSAASTTGATASYKDGSGTGYPYECRYGINPAEAGGTLEGFERRFNPSKFGLPGSPDLFRSAAEICGIYLVPQKISGATYTPGIVEPTYSTAGTWWTTGGPGGTGFRITGDNTREIPYGDLYPRLTTKSNTYTVHLRVQTLKKIPTTPATQWVEGTDQVTGEYRGSALFERYVDASDATLPDFASAAAPSVDGYYKVRIVSAKKFSP